MLRERVFNDLVSGCGHYTSHYMPRPLLPRPLGSSWPGGLPLSPGGTRWLRVRVLLARLGEWWSIDWVVTMATGYTEKWFPIPPISLSFSSPLSSSPSFPSLRPSLLPTPLSPLLSSPPPLPLSPPPLSLSPPLPPSLLSQLRSWWYPVRKMKSVIFMGACQVVDEQGYVGVALGCGQIWLVHCFPYSGDIQYISRLVRLVQHFVPACVLDPAISEGAGGYLHGRLCLLPFDAYHDPLTGERDMDQTTMVGGAFCVAMEINTFTSIV